MNSPYEWQPKIVSTQVALIGNVVIAGVPGEFTTMAGRRLRSAIRSVLKGSPNANATVVVAGLCNTYSDYITTPEEYQVSSESFLHLNMHISRFLYLILTGCLIVKFNPSCSILKIVCPPLQAQLFEGASTIYGPHTLTIYLKQYKELVSAALLVSILFVHTPTKYAA